GMTERWRRQSGPRSRVMADLLHRIRVVARFSSEQRLSSGRPWRSGVPSQVGRRLGTASHLEFCEDAGHIVLHRLFGEVELVADLLIGLAVSDEPEDSLLLA